VHHLVGLCEPNGIYLPQAHELGQGAEHGFHRTLALALHVPALWTLHPCDVAFIFFAIVGDRELFFVHFSQTRRPERTALADLARCTVRFLFGLGAAVQEHFPERYRLAPWAKVMVVLLDVLEAIGAALVGAMRGNETFKVPFL